MIQNFEPYLYKTYNVALVPRECSDQAANLPSLTSVVAIHVRKTGPYLTNECTAKYLFRLGAKADLSY